CGRMALCPSAQVISITRAPCGAFTPTGVVFGSSAMVERARTTRAFFRQNGAGSPSACRLIGAHATDAPDAPVLVRSLRADGAGAGPVRDRARVRAGEGRHAVERSHRDRPGRRARRGASWSRPQGA